MKACDSKVRPLIRAHHNHERGPFPVVGIICMTVHISCCECVTVRVMLN